MKLVFICILITQLSNAATHLGFSRFLVDGKKQTLKIECDKKLLEKSSSPTCKIIGVLEAKAKAEALIKAIGLDVDEYGFVRGEVALRTLGGKSADYWVWKIYFHENKGNIFGQPREVAIYVLGGGEKVTWSWKIKPAEKGELKNNSKPN